MLKHIFFILLTITLCDSVVAQSTQTTSNLSVGNSSIPLKIVAHTDSSIFVLGKKANMKGEWDFYVSKHSVNSNKTVFEICLNYSKLFDGKFNPDNFRYSTYQCNNKFVIFFDVIIAEKKNLIGKWIDFNGNISEAFVVDRIDMTDDNLSSGKYYVDLTSKKDLLISVRRSYKSGYQRDKCILMKEDLTKIWEYEIPKINCKREVNIISDIDKNGNLVYFVANEDNIMSEYDPNNKDKLVDKKIGNVTYKLKVRRDSLELIFINPLTSDLSTRKIYYPYFNFPYIYAISSSQILLYNCVDIDDENNLLPSKKGLVYKRVDVKNNISLFDSLIILKDKDQEYLSYSLPGRTNRPTNKYFAHTYDTPVNGRLFNVYEHYEGEIGALELITSSFNIATNKVEWTHLIPRKIDNEGGDINCFISSYCNENFRLSFYEHKENYDLPSSKLFFEKYKMVKKTNNVNFITYNISNSGELVKKIDDQNSNDFIFPWLKSGDQKHYITSRYFLPYGFLDKHK